MAKVTIPYTDHNIIVDEENLESVLKMLNTRNEIATTYCKVKGWDVAELTFEQIIEIRSLPEWVAASK